MNAPVSITLAAPRIAVIVPAYGVAHLVGEALASVRAQTFAEWECWIVDDGAPDGVTEAVAPFLADPRVRLLETAHGGVSCARNRAIARTRAPYIALLDGDDLLRPRYFERIVAALDAEPDARLVTCDGRNFGAVAKESFCASAMQRGHGRVRGTLADVLDRRFAVYIGSAFRRADWQRIGGFDETMTHCEDFDFWVRLLMLGGHALYLDEVLGEYRVRPSSASASSEKMIRGRLHAYEKVLPQLGDRLEAGVVRAMIDRERAELEFECAVDRVLAGDTAAGLASLKHARGAEGGLAWPAALALWGVFPGLAAPMLRRRRHAYNHRASAREVAPLAAEMAQ
jgi:glycosyltransferase involved in cell wall biosynthesis